MKKMPFHKLPLLALLACMAFAAPLLSGRSSAATIASAIDPDAVLGLWLAQDHDGVFRIMKCDNTLCGVLIGMRYDGTDIPRDIHGKSECGLMMLTGFVPDEDEDEAGRFNGRILDPDSGKVYHAQIWSPVTGVLKLRGYIGIPLFGETQTWTRYTGGIGESCKLPPA